MNMHMHDNKVFKVIDLISLSRNLVIMYQKMKIRKILWNIIKGKFFLEFAWVSKRLRITNNILKKRTKFD